MYLFEELAPRLNLENLTTEFVPRTLGKYYSAFGMEPLTDTWLDREVQSSEEDKAKIRAKYLELEQSR